MVNLSKRLLLIANNVPKGKRVADIGSDHALLPSYLVKEGIATYAIAGEVNEGPLLAAKKQITNLALNEFVSVRKGNGLDVIEPGEVDVITIAGMGGALITEILENGREKLHPIERLILQPNVGEEIVRKWLDINGWDIIDEYIVEEDGKIYEIIVAEPSKKTEAFSYKLSDRSKEELYRLGPILWEKKPELLIHKWKKELEKNEYILNQLAKSRNQDVMMHRIEEQNKEIAWIKGVITCLEKVNTSSKSLNS